jgi:hypothetical protein
MPDAPHDTTISPAEVLPPTPDTATTSTEHPFADPNPMTLGQGRRLYHQNQITRDWVKETHGMVSRLEGMMEPSEGDMEPLTAYMAETSQALATVLLTVRDIQTLTRRLGKRLDGIEEKLGRLTD